MSTLEFFASVVRSLAWPAAAVAIVVRFRGEISRLLESRLRRAKVGPVEIEWDWQLSRIQTELEQPGVALGAGRIGGGTISEELEPVARVAPSAAVLEGHAHLERELRRLLEAAEASEDELRVGAAGLARVAQKQGLITLQTARAVEGISVLRNLAAHGAGGDISAERAMDYLVLVDGVLFALGHKPQ